MPELPEVETVRRWLDGAVPGARIDHVTLRRPDLRYPIPVAEVQALVGRSVVAVRRRAKYLLLDCSPAGAGPSLLVHLGMTGRLFVEEGADDPAWRPHEHARIRLRRGDATLWLRYQDARRFGAIDVVAAGQGHKLLDSLGLEPFDPAFNAAALFADAHGLRSSVKALLMDGHRLVGVGNIYASEACWRARVHPGRPAGSLTLAECEALVPAIRAVLQEAIDAGGTTLRDFVGGDSNPGYFQQRLDVYARDGQPCTRCVSAFASADAAPRIERSVLANRATFHCPRCQPREPQVAVRKRAAGAATGSGSGRGDATGRGKGRRAG